MHDTLIDNINNTVPIDGHLFILGDISFGNGKNTLRLLERINVRNLYFIAGNHDNNNRVGDSLRLFRWYDRMATIRVNMSGNRHRNVILCRYPLLSWNGMHRGNFHFHGHCHGSLRDVAVTNPNGVTNRYYDALSWDVGCNVNNYVPVSFDYIYKELSNRDSIAFDHHN